MINKYWFVSAFLAFSLSALAQSGVSVKTVSKAGVLHSQFQGESLERVKVLKLKGTLNKQDIKFINNELHVTDLDLSEASFDSSIAREGHFPSYLFEKQQSSLQRLVLPVNIRYVDDYAFTDMFKLEHIVIRSVIQTVGKSAFKGCGRLAFDGDEFKEASLIDDYAFYECSSITSIKLSKAVNKLGLKAFWGCKSLKRVEFDPKNEELLFIPEGAFCNCASLEYVDVPTLVKSIDKSAFVGCTSLGTLNMRTIIPPMLADNAFDELVPVTSVVVNEQSLKLYKKSSNWRRFRDFFVTDRSRVLYEKGAEEERIKPTVIRKDGTVRQTVTTDSTKGNTQVMSCDDFPNGKDTEPTVKPIEETAKPKEGAKDKKDTTAQVKKDSEKKEKKSVVVVTNQGSRTPVLSVPEKKKESEVKEDEDSFARFVRENTRITETKPTKYYDSPIINQAVSELTLYVKNGMVHIEAPARIRQLSIIDSTGRTIYANRLSDTLYNTSVEQSMIKLIRAVYENGIETKRFH
jgi:surface antigen bspA-like